MGPPGFELRVCRLVFQFSLALRFRESDLGEGCQAVLLQGCRVRSLQLIVKDVAVRRQENAGFHGVVGSQVGNTGVLVELRKQGSGQSQAQL